MKKILFMAATAACMGVMTSCSQEDDIVASSGIDNNTIVFATSSAKAATRSAVTINSLDKFTVSAVTDKNESLFSNELFTFDATANVFKSASPILWPDAMNLSFYAINDPGTLAVDANNVPEYTYSNWTAEKDIVAATVKTGSRQTPYPLTFKHLTSQIYVSAAASDKTFDLTYKLVSINLTAPSTGKYSFSNETDGVGTWEIDDTKTSVYSYDSNLPVSFKNDQDVSFSSYYWNILPVSKGVVSFAVEYQVYQGDRLLCDYTGANKKICEVVNPNLMAGKKYNYHFVLSANTNEITFTMSMSDWENGNSSSFITSTDKSNGHEFVDLQLPSGNKWSKMNLGASVPEEYGDYYAWSEIEPRYTSLHFTNPYSLAINGWKPGRDNGYSMSDMPNYTGGDLDASHDAARQNWGANWRIPTKEDFQELFDNCDLVGVTINGYPCNKFTSRVNGKYILLPLAGYIRSCGTGMTGGRGVYWTSTNSTTEQDRAGLYELDYSSVRSYYTMDYSFGISIRPVFSK